MARTLRSTETGTLSRETRRYVEGRKAVREAAAREAEYLRKTGGAYAVAR